MNPQPWPILLGLVGSSSLPATGRSRAPNKQSDRCDPERDHSEYSNDKCSKEHGVDRDHDSPPTSLVVLA